MLCAKTGQLRRLHVIIFKMLFLLLKFFLRYVDNIVRTIRGDNKELLVAVNSFHPNPQFTLETTDDQNGLPFLQFNQHTTGE